MTLSGSTSAPSERESVPFWSLAVGGWIRVMDVLRWVPGTVQKMSGSRKSGTTVERGIGVVTGVGTTRGRGDSTKRG